MITNKMVSIVIPSYNHEKYIIDCLESIKAQSYKNIEIIIGDDCSSDNTFEVAKEWVDNNKERFVRTRVIRNKENKGITKNSNYLISLCEGDYIKDMASDDILDSEAISNMVHCFEIHDDVDVVFGNGKVVNEETTYPVNRENIISDIYQNKLVIEMDFFDALYRRNFIAAPAAMFRKETFVKYGYYDESLCLEDREYFLRVALKGKIQFCDRNIVFYRRGQESASNYKRNKEGIAKFRRFYKDEEKILNKYSTYTNETMDIFWISVLKRAIHYRDYKTIIQILKDGKIKFSIKLIKRVRELQRNIYSASK